MVVTRSSSRTQQQEVHVVTGGGGYAGFNLGKALAKKGHSVKLFDIRAPVWDLVDGMEFIQGSVCDAPAVQETTQGADVVYHLASYGMSGREQLNKKLIEQVNIGGTTNVLEACLQNNVSRCVYTSTYNVVYYGEEIRDGDESLPYVPEGKFTDLYSKTKMKADRMVLAHNGRLTADGESTLRCCVLRLAGVYGPGEQRHIPRIVGLIEQGLFCITVGHEDTRVDFLHVDNLVQAHIKAGQALAQDKDHLAAGKAYFISDNKPINNFEMFRPLVEGLGYKYPTVKVPVLPVFYFAWLTEIIHSIVSPVYNFQPLMTRTEVYKTSVTHYFSTQRAKKELGYIPSVQNDMSGCVAYYRKLGRVKGHMSSSLVYYLVSLIIIGLIYTALVYYLPKVTSHLAHG